MIFRGEIIQETLDGRDAWVIANIKEQKMILILIYRFLIEKVERRGNFLLTYIKSRYNTVFKDGFMVI